MGEESVYNSITELCRRFYDTEIASSQGWRPHAAQERDMWVRKLRIRSYSVLLKKTIVKDPSGQEDAFTAEEGKGGMCPMAQLVGRALVLWKRGEVEAGDHMSRVSARILECGMHNDPEFDRIFRFLLYLTDSVPSKQNLEPRIFKFRQTQPYEVGSYLEVPPYEEPDFTPPKWLERMLEEPTAGVEPLNSADGRLQGPPGSGLHVLSRFVNMPDLEKTYGEVPPYNLPDLPPPRLLEPRGLTVPRLLPQSDPDEGYRSTSKGTSCASPTTLDPVVGAVVGVEISSDTGQDRTQEVSDDELWKAALSYRIPRLRTWETLGERVVEHELPFLSEAGEEAAVKLWEFQSTEADPLFQVASREELMNGLYHVLLGEPSHFFQYNKVADELQLTSSLVVEGLSPGTVAKYCEPFVVAGTCYRRLRDRCRPDILLCSLPSSTVLCANNRQGLVTQALWENVSTVLQFYQGAVLLMPVNDAMLTVMHWTHGLIEKIRELAQLCCVAPTQPRPQAAPTSTLQSLPSGAKLVTYVYRHVTQEIRPDVRCLYISALKASAGVYFRFIERWVFEGSLWDEYGEFFIQPALLANAVSTRWEWSRSYKLLKDLVPGFLLGLEEAILLCGKTVNLLRSCCPKSALCVALQSGHPRMPCCLSSCEVRAVEQECRAYEERVHCVAGGPPKRPSELWAPHRPGALLRGREAELQAAREQHLLRLQEEHATAVRAEAERKLEQQKDLLRQVEEVRFLRQEARRHEQQEEKAASQYIEQQQKQQEQLQNEERERLLRYYKALGEQAERRQRRAQWRLDRLRLAPHRRQLLEQELPEALSETLPTAALSSRPGSLALPSMPAGGPGHVVPDVGGKAAGDCVLAPTASPNNNTATATDNMPADDRQIISSESQDENKNMAMVNRMDGQGEPTQVPTVEDAAQGNVMTLRPLEVNRTKMLHEEFQFCNTATESTDKNAWPRRLLSEEAARNRRRVLEEFGLALAPEIVPTSKNNRNFRDTSAITAAEEDADSAAAERLRNRWNMLHGDVNTLTGAAHFPAAAASSQSPSSAAASSQSPSSAASPEDSPMPPLRPPTPQAPSCGSLDLGSGHFSLETPTPSSSEGCTSLDSFKTANSEQVASGPVPPNTPFWRSNRLSLGLAPPGDNDETVLLQEGMVEKANEKIRGSMSISVQEGEEEEDEEREPTKEENENRSFSQQEKQVKEDDRSLEDDLSDCTLIAVALQKSVMLPVWTQLRLANQAVLQYFFVELRLYRHFLALRDYLLLMDGEFGCSLSCALFTRAASARCASDLLNFAALNAVLRDALQASLHGGDSGVGDADDPACRLSFQLASPAPEHIDLANPAALQCLALRYRVEWPLCVVITDYALARYNDAFGFLLALRRAAWALEDCFHRLKVLGDESQQASKLHRIMVWRHEMMQFVNAVQSYITCSALTSSWEGLERCLEDVTTLDDLYKCHVDYLKIVLKRCFLYRHNKKVHEHLMKALQRVLVFHQEVLTAHWDMQVLSRRHHEYVCAALNVFRLLKKMAIAGTGLNVVELVEMLDANSYYTRLSKTLKTVK